MLSALLYRPRELLEVGCQCLCMGPSSCLKKLTAFLNGPRELPKKCLPELLDGARELPEEHCQGSCMGPCSYVKNAASHTVWAQVVA